MGFFKDWIFKQLPGDYQNSDPSKNGAGEGVLQRYLQTFGDELDEQFIPFVEDFMECLDLINCDDKYLPYISGILGYPPNINGIPETYRKILAYAIAIYKIKGTKKSYEIAFNLIGLEITFIEEVPRKKITYDNIPVAIYDEEPSRRYDSECDYCSGYTISYTQTGAGVIPIATPIETILEWARKIICWLEPINAKFIGFIPPVGTDVEVEESVTLIMGDDIQIFHA